MLPTPPTLAVGLILAFRAQVLYLAVSGSRVRISVQRPAQSIERPCLPSVFHANTRLLDLRQPVVEVNDRVDNREHLPCDGPTDHILPPESRQVRPNLRGGATGGVDYNERSEAARIDSIEKSHNAVPPGSRTDASFSDDNTKLRRRFEMTSVPLNNVTG